MDDTRHTVTDSLTVRDVTDDGQLKVDYDRVDKNATATLATHKSLRLPLECLFAISGGHVDLSELTAEERHWIEYESDTTLEAAR